MSANTNERFREVEPLQRTEGGYQYAFNAATRPDMLIIGSATWTVPEARALRDWLTKALPEEKP